MGWGWEAGILPEDLWGLGEWHVQWLVPGLCPQVTQGRTKQAGLCPRACPSLACDADGGQWPLAEGNPQLGLQGFLSARSKVMKGPSSISWEGWRAGGSRDPKLRQHIPQAGWRPWVSSKALSGQAQSPLGTVISLGFSLGFSLGPWETRATLCHTHDFRLGPTESPGFVAPLTKRQPQRTSLLLSLTASAPQNFLIAEPLPGMLFPLEARLCSPGPAGGCFGSSPGPRFVYVTQCSFDQKSLNTRFQWSWASPSRREHTRETLLPGS